MRDSERYGGAAVARRVAALKAQLAELQDTMQDTLAPREAAIGRVASDARDWVVDHAKALPRLDFGRGRGRRSVVFEPAVVAAAALVVGVGVGCVLYALTSGRRTPPASASPKGGVRRPSSRGAE